MGANEALSQPAVAEDSLHDIRLSTRCETNDLHCTATVGTFQRIDFVDSFDQPRPRRYRTLVRETVGGLINVDSSPIDGYLFRFGSHLGPHAPLAMRVPAVITNEMLGFIRDVLSDFGQKIQCAEDLKVAPRSLFQINVGRL